MQLDENKHRLQRNGVSLTQSRQPCSRRAITIVCGLSHMTERGCSVEYRIHLGEGLAEFEQGAEA